MKINQHTNWIRADLKAHINPPSTPLINMGLEEELERNITKFKIQNNPATSTSETNYINIITFEDRQSQEFPTLLKNFSITIDATSMTSASGRINYLVTMLHRAAIREFKKLARQNSGTTNDHLNQITKGLLSYFPLSTPYPSISE